jgi:glucuronate isomerase
MSGPASRQPASGSWQLDPDRCFSPLPAVRELARELYAGVAGLPLVCPHGHVPSALLADPHAQFGNPAEFFVVPDHYLFRMLHSQGIPLGQLGVPTRDGSSVESDGRAIWQLFAENFHLFRGTPSGLWLHDELVSLFGVTEKLTGESAQRIYDHLTMQLASPQFQPRELFRQFNIEVLCTTDAATDTLEEHAALQAAGLNVLPTFRPDRLLDVNSAGWRAELELLEERSGLSVNDLRSFLAALEQRRDFFRQRGARATDHSAISAELTPLPPVEAETLFARALQGSAGSADAQRLNGHLLCEMARMSTEDGLVMQLHVGSLRNHDTQLAQRFGPDKGADIPVTGEWTRGLQPLLNLYGNDSALRLILFTLDESTYARELAPLAGYWPALRLGPPWWFHDSVNGIERYLDQVVETAGFYNLAGFNDDTRAFASIPSRHDVWRRTTSNWLAGQVTRGLLERSDAADVARWLAYDAAKAAYRLD